VLFAHPGTRRTNIDDDSDDDGIAALAQRNGRSGVNGSMHPVWQALHEEGANLTPSSETGSAFNFSAPVTEVKTLSISHMSRQCSAADVYKAFSHTKETMRIDWKSETSAYLHFDSADAALQAYFGYLSSSHSIGTVEPLDLTAQSDLAVATGDKNGSAPDLPPIKKRSSWTPPATTGKLLTLSSLSTWRSNSHASDKAQAADLDALPPSLFSKGHRTSSSRSSIHSKSTDRIPSLARESSTATNTTLASESSSNGPTSSMNAPRSPGAPSLTSSQASGQTIGTDSNGKKEHKPGKRFLPSNFGFGFRHGSKSKQAEA
jgi:hypothetical protein